MNIITSFLKQKTFTTNNKDGIDYESIVPYFPVSETIPRHLYQICIRNKGQNAKEAFSQLPINFQCHIQELVNSNLNWDYHFFGDQEAESFIRTNYGETILSYYHRIENDYGAAKADFLRYLIIYSKGGVYLDIKSGLKKKLDDTIYSDDKYLIFYWGPSLEGKRHYLIPEDIPHGEYITGIIAASAGHLFSRQVIIQMLKEIDHYNPYTVGVGWQGTQMVTGPAMYTKTLYFSIQKHPEVSFRYVSTTEFGFCLAFFGDYKTIDYQEKIAINDYRKNKKPVIRCSNSILQLLNTLYLKIINRSRNK